MQYTFEQKIMYFSFILQIKYKHDIIYLIMYDTLGYHIH